MSSIFDSLQKAQRERRKLARDEESAQTDTRAEKEHEDELDSIELQPKTRSSNFFGRVFWLAVLLSVIVAGFLVFQHEANGVEPIELLRRYFENK